MKEKSFKIPALTREDVDAIEKLPYSLPDNGNRMLKTEITELDRGYIVKICDKTFSISTKVELKKLLMAYIDNPGATTKEYFDGNLFF